MRGKDEEENEKKKNKGSCRECSHIYNNGSRDITDLERRTGNRRRMENYIWITADASGSCSTRDISINHSVNKKKT